MNLISFEILGWGTERSTLHVASAWSSDSHGPQPAPLVQFRTEFNTFAIGQASETLGLNSGLMDKDITAAIVWLNKAKSLDGVEPG